MILNLIFQEWRIINAYSVRVRQNNKLTNKYSKMSLQLYAVDYKSYLLDFKSLATDDTEDILRGELLVIAVDRSTLLTTL